MRLQDNLDKLLWTGGSKLLLVGYGFVSLVQIRYLSPEEFGLYALFQGILQFIVLFGDGFALDIILRYGAVTAERKRADAIALLFLLLLFAGCSLFFYIAAESIASFFHNEQLSPVFHLLPIALFATYFRMAALKFLIRDIAQKRIFLLELAFTGTMTALTFIFISKEMLTDFSSLAIISIGGLGISSLAGLLLTLPSWRCSLAGGSVPLRQYLLFTGAQGYSTAAQNSIRHLDVYLIEFFFTTSTVGIYNSAKTLYRLFEHAFVAASSLAVPLFARLQARNNIDELRRAVRKTVMFFFIVLVVVCGVLWAGAGELLITIFLPVRYHYAVNYFHTLLFAVLCMPFSLLLQLSMTRGALREVIIAGVGGAAVAFVALFFASIWQIEALIPIGQIALTAATGAIAVYFTKKSLDIGLAEYMAAFGDIYAFLKKRAS